FSSNSAGLCTSLAALSREIIGSVPAVSKTLKTVGLMERFWILTDMLCGINLIDYYSFCCVYFMEVGV
ncbi:hypothetical protein ACTHS1_12915, partial [Neisseria sp. P0014.S008]|uniref:hypothetical protein n=1 Tax=Neisseria sp. P0014.S008 TaxID=3436754 RepID=UPI003F7E88A0